MNHPYSNAPQQNSLGPPGLMNINITDPNALPRPDMTASAVYDRLQHSDLPSSQQPSVVKPVDPATCPAEIFQPADPRCVRLTTNAFPSSKTLASKYAMPLGAVVQPLSKTKHPIPIVNFGTAGIVRCRQCRSYINYTCKFLDGGRRWKCSLCQTTNEVPAEYFSPLDQNGKRRDAAQRPELHRGSIEFVAPAEYMVRPPMPPVYLFLLETSSLAVQSGALQAALAGIRNSIESMPNEGRTRVGIITFDSTVQFYLLKSSEACDDAQAVQPKVYVISDIEDIFLPTPEDILAQLSDCRQCLENTLNLIEQTYIPTAHQSAPSSGASCFGSALQCAHKVMELLGGKLLAFISSRPTIGPGKLRERGETNGILGTDRERSILRSETTFYRELSVSMSKCQMSVDLFATCPSSASPKQKFIDLATISQIAKYTGGEIFHTSQFDARIDGPRLQLAVNRVLSRESGLEAVMRIRATKGIRCTKFSGRFFVRSTDLLAMPNVDEDKAYTAQFSIEDVTLTECTHFTLQVALLYTTTSGERRIRVHTVSSPLVNNLHDLLYSIDVPASANILTRTSAEAVKDRTPEDLRKLMIDKLSNSLAKYRAAIKTQYPGLINSLTNGQQPVIITTETAKLLPLFTYAIARSVLLNRDVTASFVSGFDDKIAILSAVDVMSVAETSALVLPNIIQIIPASSPSEAEKKDNDKQYIERYTVGVPAQFASMQTDRILLFDAAMTLVVWIGNALTMPFISALLGNETAQHVHRAQQLPDPRLVGLELMRRGPSLSSNQATNDGTSMVAGVYAAVSNVIAKRSPFVPVLVAFQGDAKTQAKVESLVAEERTASVGGYRDFMVNLHRSVSQNSS